MNTFNQQGCIEELKVKVKTLIVIYILFFLFIKESWNNISHLSHKYSKTAFSNDNKVWFFFFKISEGPCDTEDWSNNAENTALRHRNI